FHSPFRYCIHQGLYVVGPVKSPLPVHNHPVVIPLTQAPQLLREEMLIVIGHWLLIDLLAVVQSVRPPEIDPAVFARIALSQEPLDILSCRCFRPLVPFHWT